MGGDETNNKPKQRNNKNNNKTNKEIIHPLLHFQGYKNNEK